ncbi:MAG TPA: PAS domain S-box protein [Rhodothermales bacterium]|nr:PAS domain S-box protein [Rhodothermales bacterium]
MTRTRDPSLEVAVEILDGLAQVLDVVPDAMIVVEDDGTIVMANERANALFGYSRGKLRGRNLRTLIPESFRGRHSGHVAQFFESPVARAMGEMSIDALRADGSVFPAEISLNPLRGPDTGTVVVCAIRDVTDRREAILEMEKFHSALEDLIRERTEMLEEATNRLQRQTEALDHILDSMGEGVIVVDQDGRFEYFNPAAEEMLGVGPTEERTDRWPEVYGMYSADEWTLLSPDQLPLVRALRGEKVDNAMIFVRNDAMLEGRHISVTARPLPSEQGKPSGAVAVFRDVTSQKRSEEGLRKSSEELERRVVERTLSLARANRELSQKIEERQKTEDALRVSERQLRLMADSLPLLVAYVDLKHRYLFMNAAYRDWFGVDTTEVIGKPVWEVVGVERYKELRPFMESALQGTHVFTEIEVRHRSSGLRRLQMNLVPDVDDHASVQGFYAVGVDMSGRME